MPCSAKQIYTIRGIITVKGNMADVLSALLTKYMSRYVIVTQCYALSDLFGPKLHSEQSLVSIFRSLITMASPTQINSKTS